ncbi:MAG: DUF1573 domain-containing protein [Desulfarculaceae bacterium]|nr:DUF1573 domain-containing protein [Desulfarculaceae bacterium]MCF8073838.1 DUF1573 domain-containing protein [Desulfarculaceae bacterium]MCF8102818.1 DUF1573 domain-containing protein [Desulfarculaceae bacterium]MCF8116262.1 DUF1573 domain-containing protein [Desulfarculaceae bacterium]
MARSVLAAVCMLLVLALGVMPAAALKGPKIAFDQQEITFAKVKEGEKVTAVFKFTNQGDQNLIIDQVSPACGCTASRWDKVTPPGEKGSVTLVLDTTGINGGFRKSAAVATNDPASPVVTIFMNGDTVGRISIDEGRRITLKGCLGSDITATATLRDPEGRPLLISQVENPMADYLAVTLDPQPGGKVVKLHLKSKATEAMEYAGPLFLSIPGSPPVSVWVLAQVQGPFTVRPHEVAFGTIDKNAPHPPKRSVLVTKACAGKLVVDSLIYNRELFKVEEHWEKPGERLLLVITPRLKNMWPGPFEKTLDIQTKTKAFAVNLTGQVR